MISEIRGGVLILLLSVLAASAAQIFLKLSANETHSSRLKEYMNGKVILGYGLLFGSTILTMLALRTVPLSWSPAIESVSYLLVTLAGWRILGERISGKKAAGLALILVGIAVFTL